MQSGEGCSRMGLFCVCVFVIGAKLHNTRASAIKKQVAGVWASFCVFIKSVRFYCRRFHVEEEVSHTHILTELIISLWSKKLSLNFHHLLGIMTYRVIAQFYKRVSVYLRCGFLTLCGMAPAPMLKHCDFGPDILILSIIGCQWNKIGEL